MDVQSNFKFNAEVALDNTMTLLDNLYTGLKKSPIDNEQVRAMVLQDFDILRQQARCFSALHLMFENFDNAIKNADEAESANLDFEKLYEETIEKETTTEHEEFEAHWTKFDLVHQAILYNPENSATALNHVNNNAVTDENTGEEVVVEEEIIIENEEIRMLDPITKLRIVNPVKNKVCNHVYDHTAILQYIKENRMNRMLCQCPQPGCHNKKQLLEKDIEDYPDYFERAAL